MKIVLNETGQMDQFIFLNIIDISEKHLIQNAFEIINISKHKYIVYELLYFIFNFIVNISPTKKISYLRC
jgi:hypothetical protein